MERKVLIIHHDDMDGKFSGALIYNYEKNADWKRAGLKDPTED